jgi:hypothetical protein
MRLNSLASLRPQSECGDAMNTNGHDEKKTAKALGRMLTPPAADELRRHAEPGGHGADAFCDIVQCRLPANHAGRCEEDE